MKQITTYALIIVYYLLMHNQILSASPKASKKKYSFVPTYSIPPSRPVNNEITKAIIICGHTGKSFFDRPNQFGQFSLSAQRKLKDISKEHTATIAYIPASNLFFLLPNKGHMPDYLTRPVYLIRNNKTQKPEVWYRPF